MGNYHVINIDLASNSNFYEHVGTILKKYVKNLMKSNNRLKEHMSK